MAGSLRPTHAGERPNVFVVDRGHLCGGCTLTSRTAPTLLAWLCIAGAGIVSSSGQGLAGFRTVHAALVAADELFPGDKARKSLHTADLVALRRIVCAGNSTQHLRACEGGLGHIAGT